MRLPHEDLVYFGDTARCPYGPRPLAEVQRVRRPGGLVARRAPASSSWSSRATRGRPPRCRSPSRLFDVPVIGVVEPGARAAVKATREPQGRRHRDHRARSSREPTSRAVRALDAGVTVFSVATPKFVDVVEQGLRMGPGTLEEWLAEFSDVFVRPSRSTRWLATTSTR